MLSPSKYVLQPYQFLEGLVRVKRSGFNYRTERQPDLGTVLFPWPPGGLRLKSVSDTGNPPYL